ncbi:capsular polysaccharide transport system permease protein [Limimaricola variabilis]|uniref:Capsular polysaccharide transport system permease protein n=1 Tax=Limimaricola variabilis TaxID=1492771 RepID=A0ABR6HMU7_9RHOB|nr:capsule biosynthesis protein [Limimaricola variabilis]MBB3711731.1 capsular polysaccharide transport system permease protein [Limimaricola variabilis]
MTTPPRVTRYRLRAGAPLTPRPADPARAEEQAAEAAARAASAMAMHPLQQQMPETAPGDGDGNDEVAQQIDRIRREGLTGRQLRMARRVAQKQGLDITSDFDAVRQLRDLGIDPFQRSNIIELVVPAQETAMEEVTSEPRVQLPSTIPDRSRDLPSTERVIPSDTAERRASEIRGIQRDLARRRRRRMGLLMLRLALFVLLPTVVAGYYFFVVATPMYATRSEFVIQQAEPQSGAGLGGLFQGTSMATQQDSITVQSYLTSRAAMVRLDEEEGFKEVFSDPAIDPLQRLPQPATNEAAYALYQDHVKISYDPTEGIVKMEVIAPDPETSQRFSEALLGYAEEQVDQLTSRLRNDQMQGARDSYEAAEARRADALANWLRIQQEVQQIDPVGETAARTQQISALETQRQQLQLELQTRLGVRRPNEAQVNSVRSQIAGIEALISDLRREMTEASEQGASLAARNTELRLAEEDYGFQTLLVQQALQQMEAAQIEANRQVRYLSLGVEPVAPDEATYPRAVENTALAFLIFSGIYLMLSLTVSILREQVSS